MRMKQFKPKKKRKNRKTQAWVRVSLSLRESPVASSRGRRCRSVRRGTRRWRQSWTRCTRLGPDSPIHHTVSPRSSCSSSTRRRRSWRRYTDRRWVPTPTSDRRRAKLREGVARLRPRSPPETPVSRRTRSLYGALVHAAEVELR